MSWLSLGGRTTPWGFLGLESNERSWNAAKVAILPVPYDGGSSYRTGARDGPRAIIQASVQLETYDLELDTEIFRVGLVTLPELEPIADGPAAMARRVEETVSQLLDTGKFVVTLGGDHSVTIGVLRAHVKHFPALSVLQLDAHADLREEYQESRYSHACVMRRVLDLGCPLVQVGVRSMSPEENAFIRSEKVDPFFYGEGWVWDLERETEAVSRLSADVYITIDLDVFDPSEVPSVGTPEPGGMRWAEVLSLLRHVARERNIVGFDIMELTPGEGPTASAFLAAKLTYKLLGYALSSDIR